MIGDLNELAEWDVFCRRSGWSGGAAIHIDTGMNRLGLTVTEAQGIIPADQCRRSRHHAGHEPSRLRRKLLNHPLNARQLAAFREIASLFSGVPASLSNSSGIFLGAPVPVRPGAAGCCALRHQSDAGSRQSDAAGGRAEGPHRADPQCRDAAKPSAMAAPGPRGGRPGLAIVSAGYADGYFRAASANDGTRGAEVVVAGKRCPIAGRISMDLMAVDVTDLDKNAARRGHMVTLIGEGITVDELAHHFGTIGYEVLTSLGPRYARVYKGGDGEPRSHRPRRPTPAASRHRRSPA